MYAKKLIIALFENIVQYIYEVKAILWVLTTNLIKMTISFMERIGQWSVCLCVTIVVEGVNYTSFLLLHNNLPQTEWLKTAHIYYLTVFVGQALTGLTVIWRLDWGWQVCFQDGLLMWLLVGSLPFFAAVDRRPSFPWASPLGCLMYSHHMAAGFLHRKW